MFVAGYIHDVVKEENKLNIFDALKKEWFHDVFSLQK